MTKFACSLGLLAMLVAAASGVRIQEKKSGGACECLHWNRVYSGTGNRSGVQCGQGSEISELCGQNPPFYGGLKGNFCMQTKVSWGMTRDQWCYVSADCQALGGGKQVTDTISWKTCKDEEDKTLRTMQPEELHALAVRENMDAALMMWVAYPVYPVFDVNWNDVKADLYHPEKTNATVASTLATVKS